MPDVFAESGTPEELLRVYGLTAEHILGAIDRVLTRKVTGAAVVAH